LYCKLRRTDVIGNESRSAERCARKIAQDKTPLVVGQFTSDGDSAASIGFEKGQQTHRIHSKLKGYPTSVRIASQTCKKMLALANKCFPESTGKNRTEYGQDFQWM
jgi:hypothetical protein